MGLILAMPLTVWIVIVGRNLPGVRNLAIALSADDIPNIESQHASAGPLEPKEEGWAE